jgi:hypothetical protein
MNLRCLMQCYENHRLNQIVANVTQQGECLVVIENDMLLFFDPENDCVYSEPSERVGIVLTPSDRF